MVKADGTSSRISSKENTGHTGVGRPVGRFGNLLPIVSTGSEKAKAKTDTSKIDTK